SAAIEHQRQHIVGDIAVVGEYMRGRLHGAFMDNRHGGSSALFPAGYVGAADLLGANRRGLKFPNPVCFPPPRSGGGGPPEGRWRGLACSTQADTCPYRRTFARHLPRTRGRKNCILAEAHLKDFLSSASLELPHLGDKAPEQAVAVARARRGLRVVLHRENRPVFQRQPANGDGKQRNVCP